MRFKTLLEEKNMTMYRLAQISGVPKTTVIDICSEKSSIECCNAETVYRLAQALECTVEDLIHLSEYDELKSLRQNSHYLEICLPPYLMKSLAAMKRSWKLEDNGIKDYHWDLYWCELNADINAAESEGSISKRQAGYLRYKYLRMENGGRD